MARDVKQRLNHGFCQARARKLAETIARIDEDHLDNSMDLRFGGDGDNGESLVEALTIFFEQGGGLTR